jgi:hypothetical protein
VLDVAGLVPGIGEAADLANAAWYTAKGDYLNAGLSLLSVIPVVGDVIGKGGKLATRLGPNATAKVLEALQKLDVPKFLEGFKNHPELGPHVARMEEALRKWQDDLQAQFGKRKEGNPKEDCPLKPPKKSHKERLREKLGDYIDTICNAICQCRGKGNQACVARMLSSGWPFHDTNDDAGKLLVEASYELPPEGMGGDMKPILSGTGRTTRAGAPAPASVPKALARAKALGKGESVRWDCVLVKDPKKAADFDNVAHFIEVKFGKGAYADQNQKDKYTRNQKEAAKRGGRSFGKKFVLIRDSHCECTQKERK